MVSTNGIPPKIRRAPPCVGIATTGVTSSFQSRTWCSKYTASPCVSAISATGTSSPSTCTVELANRNSVMSRSRGASRQPESLTMFRTSSGAPQVKQDVAPGAFCSRHHWHSMRSTARNVTEQSPRGCSCHD